MKRNENESYLSYAKRLTSALEDKIINYKEYGDLLLGVDNNYSNENIRKFSYCFKKVLKKIDENTTLTNVDLIGELENQRFETLKERKKLQSINLEYQRNAREEGRFELFLEMIKDAVNNLEPIEIKPIAYTKQPNEITGVLFVADAHYGRDLEMKGLFDEVVNVYNPKEFETRMWSLLNQMANDNYFMTIDKLDIIDAGDNIEGILRVGESLKNLKTGVVDSVIQYAEFMAKWIIECQNRLKIPVSYRLTGGNHDILRLLNSKPNFEEENVGKFIYNHINLRVENSKLKAQLKKEELHIEIKPYNDVLYQNYYGMNVLVYHGEGKNMKEDIEFFENYYNIDVDILVGGHLHRGSAETIGIGYMGDREIIRVPSICGSDTYSKKIRKLARAGAKIMTFTEDGKGWEKNYYLN